MIRIKISDLPRDLKISKAELKKVIGGFNPQPEPPGRLFGNINPPDWAVRPRPGYPGAPLGFF
jgi:hypothetical protein